MDLDAGGMDANLPDLSLQASSQTLWWTDARVLDCLSLAFAFLPTRDFACAIRCNKA